MSLLSRSKLIFSVISIAFIVTLRAENWPQWRGPAGTGLSGESRLPIVWNETRGVLWRCKLPEWGVSTPAIWDDAIFVTSQDHQGKLLLLRIDKITGDIVWQKVVGVDEVVRVAPVRSSHKFHELHNLASPSPVTDGKRVVAHYGNGDLACYDFDGNQIWKRNLQQEFGKYTIWWGHANSPVLVGGSVISVCMQDSLSDLQDSPVESYVVAHDLRDGHQRWRTIRKTDGQAEACDAYTTPLAIEVDGRRQLVVMGGNQLDAYDPATGKQLWYLPGLKGGRTVPSPTYEGGIVFATAGMKNALVAVQVGKPGELNHRDIRWRFDQGTPDTCSPVVWNRLLFTVTDEGVVRCCDALGGQFKWRSRLKGEYKASPIAAAGRVYFLNTTGLCTIVSAAPRFDRIIENQLDDETIASPAISDGKIFIRGRKTLYCIGDATSGK